MSLFLSEMGTLSFLLSHQVIGMLPGKDGQAPYVTCGAKVSIGLSQ